MAWMKAEWEYLLWKVGWRKFCLPGDETYWGWGGSHRNCRCSGLWRR